MVLDWAIRDDGSCQPPPPNGGASAKPTAPACEQLVSTPYRGVGTSAIAPRDTRVIPIYVTGANGCTSEFFCFQKDAHVNL